LPDLVAPPVDTGALAPFLIVAAGAIILLLLDLVVSPERRNILGYFAVGTTLVAIGACVPLWDQGRTAFAQMVVVDNFGLFASVIALASTALAVLLAIDYIERHEMNYGEYYPLILFTASGMLLMVMANDLIMIFIGLEVLSIGLYILAGFARGNQRSEESALKYFLLGSFSLGFLVYGASLVYGATGTTNFSAIGIALDDPDLQRNPILLAGLAMILVGFAFKLALAPFHAWTPDVYTGAPTSVTAFMSVGTKVATFAALLRMVLIAMPQLRIDWAPTLWALAVVTMIVGNLAAVTQRNIKRMLAYSSIGQAGYILVAVVAAERPTVRDEAVTSILFYLLAYTFMNLGAFAVVIALSRPGVDGAPARERLDLETDYAGLARRHPVLAGALALFMLSLGGIPPTAGFFGKLLVFRAAVDAGYWPLALVGVITSIVALGFYLRVIILMYTREPDEYADTVSTRVPVPLAAVLVICVLLTLQLGILPALSLGFAEKAFLGQ
jgi:NADH-quinone oxidoreductase subunit N